MNFSKKFNTLKKCHSEIRKLQKENAKLAGMKKEKAPTGNPGIGPFPIEGSSDAAIRFAKLGVNIAKASEAIRKAAGVQPADAYVPRKWNDILSDVAEANKKEESEHEFEITTGNWHFKFFANGVATSTERVFDEEPE